MLREITISTAALAMCAGVAAAQNGLSTAGSFEPGSGGQPQPGVMPTYTLDDGTAENAIGLTDGGEIVAANQFQVVDDLNVIDSIDVTWGNANMGGNSGLFGGESFDVFVWQGSLSDAGNATLIGSASGTVDIGAVDNNVFQSVGINAAISGGNGTNFFIGAAIDNPVGFFPAALDETDSQMQSWAIGSGTPGGFDPDNLLGNDVVPTQLDAIGLGGNFMVRANAIPAPGSAALLGLAGLAGIRRRR